MRQQRRLARAPAIHAAIHPHPATPFSAAEQHIIFVFGNPHTRQACEPYPQTLHPAGGAPRPLSLIENYEGANYGGRGMLLLLHPSPG